MATYDVAGEQAACLQVPRGHEQDGVAIDNVVTRSGEEAAVGVAVEGDSELRLLPDYFAATVLGYSAPQWSLILRPSGVTFSSVISPQAWQRAAEQSQLRLRWRSRRRFFCRRVEAGHCSLQRGNVIGHIARLVFDSRHCCRVGRGGRKRVLEDHFFDGQFCLVGQFLAVVTEKLDAIVSPGIVAGGDDCTCVKAVGMGQVGNRWSGHNAGAFNLGSSCAQPGSEQMVIHGLDSRVSRPRITRGLIAPVWRAAGRSWWARASPTA